MAGNVTGDIGFGEMQWGKFPPPPYGICRWRTIPTYFAEYTWPLIYPYIVQHIAFQFELQRSVTDDLLHMHDVHLSRRLEVTTEGKCWW